MRACSHSHLQPVGVATFDPPTPVKQKNLMRAWKTHT